MKYNTLHSVMELKWRMTSTAVIPQYIRLAMAIVFKYGRQFAGKNKKHPNEYTAKKLAIPDKSHNMECGTRKIVSNLDSTKIKKVAVASAPIASKRNSRRGWCCSRCSTLLIA